MPPPDAKPVIAVLHPEGQPPPGIEALEDRAELRCASTGQALQDAIPDAQILMITDFRSNALEQAWPHARKLAWIHATSAGVDRVLIPQVVASPIPVTNARGIFDRAIAEYVLGAMLLFAKDFTGNLRNQQERRWRHRETERLEGKRLLVAGAGSIGSTIGALARACGLEVAGLAGRRRPHDPVFGTVHGPEDFHGLLQEADFVAVAAPLTDSTHHMFDDAAFAALKPGARLINVGRGEIVDTQALMRALDSGRLAGAALDVFEEEPLPGDHPLWSRPDVMISAHMAGDFIGWERALTEQFIGNFERWQRGEALFNKVDKRRGYGAVREESHHAR
ncbi:MAG: D-2-hydroxyacid dehydrogenase [Alphaproteobacteria bacterium]